MIYEDNPRRLDAPHAVRLKRGHGEIAACAKRRIAW
jgi:hypothetical protein